MEAVECVVVGAGVVGLAVARVLALSGHETLVLEACEAPGMGTSSRNSEVVHSGIYYRPGTLKAQLSVRGRRFLNAYCPERHVALQHPGKLVVAAREEDRAELERLKAQGEANGVEGLRLLGAADVAALEPGLKCVAALFSPCTGIVDSHALMQAYRADAEAAGCSFVFKSPVVRGRVVEGGFEIQVGGAQPMPLFTRVLVNAAGLHAHEVARSIEGVPADTIPPVYYARGHYFSLRGRAPFRHLVYPTHEKDLVSIHLTLDQQGNARFGPDVQWVDDIAYDVDPARAASFYAAVRRYWPGLPDGVLEPAYAGIRPKLVAAGSHATDFVIQDSQIHGIPGLVQLYGIESPGLTSSAAIGAYVQRALFP